MKKYIVYAILPVMAFAVLGAGVVSANGWFGGGGFGMANLSPEKASQRQSEMFQHQADLFGISVDDMKNAWSEGKTFQQIAEENGISQEQIQERMQTERQERMESRLRAMVDNGVITQEQANKRLQFMEENAGSGKMMKQGFGRGFGSGRGPCHDIE